MALNIAARRIIPDSDGDKIYLYSAVQFMNEVIEGRATLASDEFDEDSWDGLIHGFAAFEERWGVNIYIPTYEGETESATFVLEMKSLDESIEIMNEFFQDFGNGDTLSFSQDQKFVYLWAWWD